jgi:hypothetical protein
MLLVPPDLCSHDSSHEQPTTTSDACEQGLRPMPPEQVESESVSTTHNKAHLEDNSDVRLVRFIPAMLAMFACEHRVRYDRPVHGNVNRHSDP